MEIYGEFRAAASTGGALSLFNSKGNAHSLTAGQLIEVEEYAVVTSVGTLVRLYFDNDDDGAVDPGELVGGGDFAANGGITQRFEIPRKGKRGKSLKVLAAAATDLTVTFSGRVTG